MALHLITGYAGTEHVTASNAGTFNASVFGTGNMILNFGRKFEYHLESNNVIRIYDGQGIMNGRHFELAPSIYEDLSIENGSQNMNRKDLVVVRYTIDTDTGIESVALQVITGEETSETAVDPDYNEGSILDNDTIVDYPLYRINISGLSVESVDKLFSVVDNVEDKIGNSNISSIGNGTVTGAISQINSNLSVSSFLLTTRLGTLTIDNQTCYRIAGICYVKVTFETSQYIGADVDILTIPKDYYGNFPLVTSCLDGYGAFVQMIRKDANKLISTQNLPPATYTMCFSYPII